jgi:hypothetical protein
MGKDGLSKAEREARARRRAAVEALLDDPEWQDRYPREIAAQAGASPHLVGHVLSSRDTRTRAEKVDAICCILEDSTRKDRRLLTIAQEAGTTYYLTQRVYRDWLREQRARTA